jgi:3-deoxy-manno-octulosonate cytidylyltransferase (CMP-KDO synthetase)
MKSSMQPLIIIPARMASTRLPNKPLRKIAGKPMICHVIDRARESNCAPILVATDHPDIEACVTQYGEKVIMTDSNLPSGSDRIWQAYTKADMPNITHIINLQGDMPTIEPQLIRDALDGFTNPQTHITTFVSPLHQDDFDNPNSVKAVVAWQDKKKGRALYFSRANLPYGDAQKWHHIGIYAYQKEALEQFVKLPPSLLEKSEKLEQLRALEAGMTIAVMTTNAAPQGVDVEADIAKVEACLLAKSG